MYVRMITYHVKEGVDRSVAASIYDELVEVLQSQEGYRGCALLLNEDASVAVSLTYWESERHAGEAGKIALPVLFERTTDISDRPPEITGYEVLEHHLSGVHIG